MKQITNTPREVYNAAHPFFTIDVNRSRIDRESLGQTLSPIVATARKEDN
jgi:hypothetical protein